MKVPVPPEIDTVPAGEEQPHYTPAGHAGGSRQPRRAGADRVAEAHAVSAQLALVDYSDLPQDEPPPAGGIVPLPAEDNSTAGLRAFMDANERYRSQPWPEPFDTTRHELRLGDARDLNWIADRSVHLVVTSPPYWTLKEYRRGNAAQIGDIADYEAFLDELDRAFGECERVLVPGGRICCVVGDVCIPRKRAGRHYIMPLHADIQVRARSLGLDCLTPVLWHKIANGATEVKGNGAGFYGKPYQPGAIVKNDVEYILSLRKPGDYRTPEPLQKALSMLTKEEMRDWMRSIWTDIRGSSTCDGHPAPFPVELAERLIRMFSFAGDTVLDPFTGTGSTSIAALQAGRNSVGADVESEYLQIALRRLTVSSRRHRSVGAVRSIVCSTGF
jgi:site-specific DNA-methyltransferase (adenine-specific)